MRRVLWSAVVGLMLATGAASAQDWQGKSKMSGKVADEAGKAIEGVTVKLVHAAANTGPEFTTDRKGAWKAEKLTPGLWLVEFHHDSFDPRQIQVEIGEKMKEPKLEVKLTKLGTDWGFAERLAMTQAQPLLAAQKNAEARVIFEKLLATYPTAHHVHKYLAHTYNAEKNEAKAVEQLELYLAGVPSDVQILTLLGSMYTQVNREPEAWKIFSTLDLAKVQDVTELQDPAFNLLRQKKPVDAVKYLDLAIQRFPEDAPTYYYRGFAQWQAGSMAAEAQKADEAKALIEKASADLQKCIELAPTSDPAGKAKQILAQIEKK
ncbi:MAG: carboxypeptidase regulatory-like domain-containing protein [Acidobacteriota bacterium]